jgi:hypothetical protein
VVDESMKLRITYHLSMPGIPVSASEEEHALFRASHEGIKQGFTGAFDKL